MNTVNKKDVCTNFIKELGEISGYVEKCKVVFNEEKQYLSFCYENAIIMVYRSFEHFLLRIMVSCLNHDHSHFEESYGIKLGRHINDDVCEFLITKGGYFDFKGNGDLKKTLNKSIGQKHPVVKVFGNGTYSKTIQKLYVLRNYAAHNSPQAKKAVLNEFNLQRVKSAGSLLKQQGRFQNIINELTQLANDIKEIPI